MNSNLTPHHDTPAARNVSAALLDALRQRFGEQLSTASAVREQHGRDEGSIQAPPPDAVVFAQSRQDVADAVRLAHAHDTPVIAYGAGSSLEGHLLAVQGGISIDVSRMNQIVSIDAEDLTVTVQPGITRKQLNEAIKHTGLFFPIDPGADASIGGMAATRASGTNAVRYGTLRENVLALEVVLANGEIIRTGTRAKKSSAGYDLTRLFVGSEGTLGIFTEVTLKLYPLPEAVSAAICSFPGIEQAVRTVISTIQLGVPIARVELLDGPTVALVNQHSKLTLREEPMLLMEFHGSPGSVQEQAQTVQEIAQEYGGQAFEWANTPEERTRLWTARHNAYFAGVQSRPGCRVITTDACVPISRLADCLLASVQEAQESGMRYFLVGHVGDGNFHFGYLIDPNDPEERARGEALNHKLVARALSMDGTCTGEHGIGIHKMDFLSEETGAGAVAVMRSIKQALDPKNILNPGKIFPWQA
ncbi:2-hydroxy-acid oxidase [Vandammella animalimorsus]|uniref:D-lactate dehydrogenase (cytochrome) n=1 Tax=Vandammella animalimorsus TaxID=2029117 RepID=A0A2A2T444_9BURK|nr:FAD-linked oxidase C-terminal domain-containing protein [Vandammella animalimorsus]PAT32377.1 2-hydroxy-acid oxidase [Vandammella animalimorsus]PAX16284.1 2-hydroxy-acid oxidase [Vandammella animalimorsus]PAX19733.1 2-hydroxy-acid oxidase [Vandammella animalimorsus]